MDTYSMIKMQSSKAKDNSFNLQKLGILVSFCSLYIAYKADLGDLFTYFYVENFVAMASFVDEQNGVVRFISDAPPTHYKLKIQLFSLLVENAVEKYESAEFEAGGYKWKLVLYPNGNKSKNVKDHISLYLTLTDTSSLPLGWEVYVVLRLFLLDQRKDNYLKVQDAIGKESHFHELKLECGFDHFVPLKAFNDASNGYLVEDKCVFGTEVFVTKERGRVKAECLSMIKDTSSVKYVWKIENFSKLNKEYYDSEAFSAGGHKWQIQLYPKGVSGLYGSHLSLYLDLVQFAPDSKVYTDCTLRIVDQLQAKHIAFNANHCFTAARSFYGWQKFITPSYLNDPGNGCIVKDVCVVEAEVNVWGCQSSTTDMFAYIWCPAWERNMPSKLTGDLLTYNSVERFVAMASFVDEQDGVVRFISDAPPTHYKVKIQLFSLLVKNAVEKYESAEFEAGGYKWKLVLYPNGNKNKNVKDHISLYLTLADTSSLPLGWEVYAVLRLFLLDQRKDVQDAIEKESHFHELKLECGFDHFVSLKAFNDASNGYLVEDRCVFGTEIFVTKERGRVKAECLSLIKDTSNAKYVWRVENFSKLSADNYFSEVFNAGGHKWKIQLYPKGSTYPKGSHLSLFLYSVDLTPGSKVYIDYTLRILDQLHAKHITFKADRCFVDSTDGWGWRNFVSLSHLNDPVNGCLVKDVCVVEAEVNVWGCQSSTADIVK